MKQDECCNLLEQVADRLNECFSELDALDTNKLSYVLSSEQLKTVLTWLRHYNYPHDAVELKQRIEKIIGWFTQLNKISHDAFHIKNRVSKGLSIPDSRKKDLHNDTLFIIDLVDNNSFNDIPEMAGELRRVATLLKKDQKQTNIKKKTALGKGRRAINWIKKHPHSYGLTGGVIFLILIFALGLIKTQWRSWCWGTAGLAFILLILSLLGGKSR